MARQFVGFNVDTSEANYMAGFLEQFSLRFGDNRHMTPVLELTHEILSEEFGHFMDAFAAANPSAFHHVYEWNRIGVPRSRLWKDMLVGAGTVRTATFRWRPSKSVVPVELPAAQGEVEEKHVFIWKAPIMEYGTTVTINPTEEGGSLAYFTGPAHTKSYELRWTKDPLVVNNPGGDAVVGAFTAAYTAWWGGGGAAEAWRTRAAPILKQEYGATKFGRALKPKTFSRKAKAASIAMNTNSDQAYATGKAAAEKFLRQNDMEIRELAERYRERNADY